MKKNVLTLSAIALLAGSVVLTSCKKDDVTAPVVTLIGGDVTISLQGMYTELGATANDSKDGKIEPVVTGTVDKNMTGVYTIEYKATDAAGNEGKTTRLVTVVNDADVISGVYTCSITGVSATYTQTVKASTTENNKIFFYKFAGYSDNNNPVGPPVYAMVTGNNLNIPSQTRLNVGSVGFTQNRTFAGTTPCTRSGAILNLNYTETTNGTVIATVESMVK